MKATLKWSGKTCRNCQVIAVSKYDLPLAGAPRIETKSGSISSMARGIGKWHCGTGQGPAGHAPGVDRVAVDREPARQEPLLLLRAKQRVSQQVDMFRDPQHLLGREPLPAMGTGHLRKQLERRARGSRNGASVPTALVIAITAIDQKITGREASLATRPIQAESRAALPAMPLLRALKHAIYQSIPIIMPVRHNGVEFPLRARDRGNVSEAVDLQSQKSASAALHGRPIPDARIAACSHRFRRGAEPRS